MTVNQMTLRDRCKHWLAKRATNAMLRQSNDVDDLEAFVMAERGRAAEPALATTLPLVLYFKTDEGRDGVIAAINEAVPGMSMKKMP